MATGACGINCNVCKLNLQGNCSTCGPASSETAAEKLAAQVRILGSPCPILACARMNRINHCLSDCRDFPCHNFRGGPYPFSQGFLEMQHRRRNQLPPAYAPDGSHLQVAEAYWQALAERDINEVCNFSFFTQTELGYLQFSFLNETIQLDMGNRRLLRNREGQWTSSDDPLLMLVTVLYLSNVKAIYPMGRDMVGIKDLKEGHFFSGPHEIRVDPLLQRYGHAPDSFARACTALNGRPLEMADAAYCLLPFPRVPLYFLLWAGDDEFKPRLQVLFDRSIEEVLAADAIWALVNRVAMAFGQL